MSVLGMWALCMVALSILAQPLGMSWQTAVWVSVGVSTALALALPALDAWRRHARR